MRYVRWSWPAEPHNRASPNPAARGNKRHKLPRRFVLFRLLRKELCGEPKSWVLIGRWWSDADMKRCAEGLHTFHDADHRILDCNTPEVAALSSAGTAQLFPDGACSLERHPALRTCPSLAAARS